MFLQTVFTKREQNHRKLGTYVKNNYTNFIKPVKMTSNSKQSRQKTLKGEQLIFQKSDYINKFM